MKMEKQDSSFGKSMIYVIVLSSINEYCIKYTNILQNISFRYKYNMKLSDYAKQKGVSYKTAWNWFNSGIIPNATQLPNGTILIEPQVPFNVSTNNVIYCRVSNASRRKELDYQQERIESYCMSNGIPITKVYKEVASGMNDNRKQFWKMIESNPSLIIIENKDRLTRFGFNYLDKLLKKQNTYILVIHQDKTDEHDLMRDLVSIITSFCCRLYGLRRGYKKSKIITDQVNDNSI